MDVIEAGLVIIAFATVRLILPALVLLVLGNWVNRNYARWDPH